VVEEISSELELRPLLTSIIRHACELLDARDGSIGLYDERREVFRTEAIYRMPIAELGREMRSGVGLAGLVLERGTAVVLDRYDQAPQPMLPILPELAANAVVGMPIFWRDRLIGFFGIGAPPPRRFDDKDVEILGLLGRHAAVAIENARLYERVQRSAVLEERNRLARELHDSVTQKMFSLALIAQTLAPAWKRDPAEGERRTERLVELSGAALAEMRSLLAELRPATAETSDTAELAAPIRDGLIAALRNLIREHAKDGLKVTFLLRGYEAQKERLEHHLFRVAQEALANVAKHARMEEATLLLAQEGSRIEIRVVDDGVGFNPVRGRPGPAGSNTGGGLGISGMRQRIERIGGRFRVSSRPGGGTIVQAIVRLTESPSP
jgi:signal transduction histidine kinase